MDRIQCQLCEKWVIFPTDKGSINEFDWLVEHVRGDVGYTPYRCGSQLCYVLAPSKRVYDMHQEMQHRNEMKITYEREDTFISSECDRITIMLFPFAASMPHTSETFSDYMKSTDAVTFHNRLEAWRHEARLSALSDSGSGRQIIYRDDEYDWSDVVSHENGNDSGIHKNENESGQQSNSSVFDHSDHMDVVNVVIENCNIGNDFPPVAPMHDDPADTSQRSDERDSDHNDQMDCVNAISVNCSMINDFPVVGPKKQDGVKVTLENSNITNDFPTFGPKKHVYANYSRGRYQSMTSTSRGRTLGTDRGRGRGRPPDTTITTQATRGRSSTMTRRQGVGLPRTGCGRGGPQDKTISKLLARAMRGGGSAKRRPFQDSLIRRGLCQNVDSRDGNSGDSSAEDTSCGKVKCQLCGLEAKMVSRVKHVESHLNREGYRRYECLFPGCDHRTMFTDTITIRHPRTHGIDKSVEGIHFRDLYVENGIGDKFNERWLQCFFGPPKSLPRVFKAVNRGILYYPKDEESSTF